MECRTEVSLGGNPEFYDFLTVKLKEFNNEQSLHHREKRKEGAVQPLHIMLTDEEGNWRGGLTAQVIWGWLEIGYFWLEEGVRGQGTGSDLLAQAETLARQMGASRSKVTTFSFQAREFYEKLGYEVVGEIKDYPPGNSYYFLVKMLQE
ncbi:MULTISPECIES: GNAT family N-acetyltransferase [unclassified Paenibacillus]|uniref:GNAT family N-acetyltransferase n=1 Tax=unclassified Paenibacillus TaxID=185978 RepID=UPI0009561CC6|nr:MULTISPECIES: GNAT family N-acetyltransferase [unclassified Paenibacillus]ASS68348.1 GNAT family N-acetyltransferase [Paenibacillus sp. RUD330]SIR29927.1 Acetyltransferase (GNAT) family protein [Paenibacillus sp. RU4X]SIR41868.1 Acetyltransferase (GNAT) family protein [Paenibacillus sp. RU4T]